MNTFHGVIIEESLKDARVLKDVSIISSKVEPITERHRTPWVKQWTLHTVEVPTDKADEIAEKLRAALDDTHQSAWYADYKDDRTHYIIFPDLIFKVDRTKKEEYDAATAHGIALGLPPYQVNFASNLL